MTIRSKRCFRSYYTSPNKKTAIGTASNNIGFWIPIGLSIGLCFGLVISNVEDKKNKNNLKKVMKKGRKLNSMPIKIFLLK